MICTNTNTTPQDIRDDGWEIVPDPQHDGFRLVARFWVEESGLFDTPDEAAAFYRNNMRIEQ